METSLDAVDIYQKHLGDAGRKNDADTVQQLWHDVTIPKTYSVSVLNQTFLSCSGLFPVRLSEEKIDTFVINICCAPTELNQSIAVFGQCLCDNQLRQEIADRTTSITHALVEALIAAATRSNF